ncbi:hypothetical protein ACVCAH_23535 [Micromonospora sp. LZ34]
MKAYTSRERFDERRRFTGVRERMGQVRLDSETNEQVVLARTDARRRSGDVAEGSPDDGFAIGDTHLVDPITTLAGWSAEGLPLDDERIIPRRLTLARREPETLPHVLRTRGHVAVRRTLPVPIDLARLPVPLHPAGATYAASALVVNLRFERPPTDDEIVDVRVVVVDADGTEHAVASLGEPAPGWITVRIARSELAPLVRDVDGRQTLVLTGWGLGGLPPRAETDIDALLAQDAALGGGDVAVRGGNGTLMGAGRLYVGGLRTFIEHDWRYSLQPDLPDPEPLQRPPAGPDGAPAGHHVVYVDVWERSWHRFQDRFLAEDALPGEETAFRSRKVTQVRALPVGPGGSETLPTPTGDGRLTTNVPSGELPDRFPPEAPDPCRDRCLFTENAAIGEGYTGSQNVHVRVEVLATHLARPVVGWSRENASLVAPLVRDAVAGAAAVFVDPADAKLLVAGDVVVVEDERSRLDGGRASHRAVLRRLAAVDAATGELELEAAGHAVSTDPEPLVAGGGLDRAFVLADAAAVRRWDGADWLLDGIRYNLADGITFALAGSDFRLGEYWSFTARVTSPDGAARGVVETLVHAPVHGPRHERAPLSRITWTPTGRAFEDLRTRFLPLHEVRDRLVELGRHKLSPGAFTVVVGDGNRTFGDIDQNLVEGVTGDEALQAALDRLGVDGGTVYLRAGTYRLEHPVLVRGRSRVRILGDGDATRVEITGAGGAFFLDWCGFDGEVSLERLNLVESSAPLVPVGVDTLAPHVPGAPGGDTTARPLQPSDLLPGAGIAVDLLAGFATRLKQIRPFEGRGAEAVVATVAQLRRLQRQRPGRPLEEVAPDELAVLRSLPHGVVTVADCRHVRLEGLTVTSREAGLPGVVNAAVLVAGACEGVSVTGCRLQAPSGVVAAPYGTSFRPESLVLWPRSGLFLHGLEISDNDIRASGSASDGVCVADGVVDGLVVEGNRIDGFARGISLQDRAETRAGEAADSSVVAGNVVTGCRDVGISVAGDGVDVAANEVRVAAPDRPLDGLTAGIQVTGSAGRIRDCWVELPGPSPAVAFALQAGIVVGSGIVAQHTAPGKAHAVPRPVHDVEVNGNRVEGQGSLATGILVGGAQPVFDVRVRGNTLRDLGDAGVRAWGYGGSVGGLRIEDNDVEATARGYLSWGADAVADLSARSGLALPATASPRDALSALLAAPGDVEAPIDDVLRWLERATLRGGIVLSLVEESEVRGNRVADVGTPTLPPGFAGPGAGIRTAGVVACGGRDLVVESNRVRRVLAPVQVIVDVPPGPAPGRPPIFDVLRSMGLATTRAQGIDTYGAAVALRRSVMDYAAGDRSVRQRVGGRIYTAMESLAQALEATGPEGRRLALELSGGIGEMQEAQGTADHTRAATHVRATLSKVAALGAADEETARAWDIAARFDGAVLGSPEGILSAATDVLEGAAELTQGLETLELDLAGKAQAVIVGSGSEQARTAARLQLAAALGTTAEGRGQRLSIERAAAGGVLSGSDRNVAEGIVRLSIEALDVPDPAELNEQTIASLERGATALADVLRGAHPPLADRVRHDFRLLRQAGGRPDRQSVQRFLGTLDAARAVAAGTPGGVQVRTEDVAAQQARFQAELVTLTADGLERRVQGLALDTESAATRNLRLLGQSAGQLVNLVGTDPELAGPARQARQAIAQAVTDVERRSEHTARARQHLRDLQEVQSRKAGISVTKPADVAATTPTDGVDAKQLAALTELLLQLRDTTDDAVREEGTRLFDEGLRRQIDAAGIRGSERESMLATLGPALATITSRPGPDAVAAALHVLSDALERVSLHAAQAANSVPDARAVYALSGTVTRALDPSADEETRLVAVSRWITGNEAVLSPSTVSEVLRETRLRGTLAAVRGGLRRYLDIGPTVRPPLQRVRIEAHAADGLFGAGVARALTVRGNAFHDARTGVTVTAPPAHPLAPLGAAAATLAVEGNTVTGGVVAALELAPDGTGALSVIGNEATACAGTAPTSGADLGQAVVRVTGQGSLLVADNRLHGNGNRRSGGPVHELLLDWRGDVTVRGNLVRHAGGDAGGAGLAVLVDEVTPSVLHGLARRPALDVEPLPVNKPFPQPGGGVFTPGAGVLSQADELLAAGLGASAGAFAGGGTFGVGAFRLATRSTRPEVTVTTMPPPPPPSVDLPQNRADEWVATAPTARFEPLVEFLLRLPPPFVLPVPLVRRAVHVAGNDVVAAGPALLLLAQGAIVSATVVGNELESTAPTGAVYLRGVDTTVFASNRCECLGLTNVVVLRAGKSLVGVQGNVAAGAEPPAPPPPPFIPVHPELGKFSDLVLQVKVGPQATMNLKLDEQAVLNALDTTVETSYRDVSEDAEATFNLFAKQQKLVTGPGVANVLTFGARDKIFRFERGTAGPVLERPTVAGPVVTGGPAARSAEESGDAGDTEPAVTAAPPDADVERAFVVSNTILENRELPGSAKLYGMAVSAGLPAHQARALVQTQLARAGGDQTAALAGGLAVITGVVDVGPTVTERVERAHPVENLLAMLLRNRKFTPVGPPIIAVPPPPPDPRRHSMVVVGGSRVAATGNVTTAGVHVHDAAQAIENNL